MSFSGLNSRGHMIRQRFKQPESEWLIIPRRSDKTLLGPSLPRVDGVTWCQPTRDWYNEIRRSDIAQLYEETDWQTLLSAALLHNAIWSGTLGNRDKQGFQTELRQKESELFLTPQSRRRNKIAFADEAPQERTKPNQPKVDYKKAFGDSES